MAMTAIWTGMTTLSLLCALVLGRGSALAPAALEGAAAAVELALGMAGALCLWMGVMEVMARAGLAEKLAKLLSPLLSRLFPDFRQDRGVMDAIAANVSANLLGLGNAATPLGLEAARRMSKKNPRHSRGQSVYAGGVQHRLHPAPPHHRGGGAAGGGVQDPL